MAGSWTPDIYEFLDYREYLGAYYEAAKENVPAFSYRYFSRRAGYSSPNYLKLVMDGERNLTEKSTHQMIKGLGLEGEEARFFRALVNFNQATSAREKNEYFEEVSASRRFRSARRIDRSMFEYLSCWYYPAIREMAARDDFRDDPAWIGRQLFPRVPAKKVREALDLLLELGLLERDEDGAIVRGEPALTTGHEVRSLAIGNYHRQMLERAAESIDTVPREMRDVSGMTVCIDAATVAEIKGRIHTFREQLMEICERETDEDKSLLYQICFQLFPLSRWESE